MLIKVNNTLEEKSKTSVKKCTFVFILDKVKSLREKRFWEKSFKKKKNKHER